MIKTVTISKETLQTLLMNFYEVCSLCDEMDIYEAAELDESMQEMKSWTEKTFGYKITKTQYD